MGWTKGKCHNVVPFEYGESGFDAGWPHWTYKTERYPNEFKEEPWLAKNWQLELGKVGQGEWLICQGHCDAGMSLKPGRNPKGGIDAAELCKRLKPLVAKCHIVVWACLSLRLAIDFARKWEKARGKGWSVYGTKIPVKQHDLSAGDLIPIGDPLKANLKTLAGDWEQKKKDAESLHKQLNK